MNEKAVIVIPARMASTRFPNKPLAYIKGITMIERVWRIAKAVQQAHEVIIATDDNDLKLFAEGFGAKVMMTSADCLTGTDRVAEVARCVSNDYTIFFSLQGDAVLTPPWVIEKVLNAMLKDPEIKIATPAVKLTGKALIDFIEIKKSGSSSGTTVVFDQKYNALYFSKALIPYSREGYTNVSIYRHIGLYAYRLDTLLTLNRLPEGILEYSEKLEQLRALENGIPIKVVSVDYQGRTHGSVDRPEDIAIVEEVINLEGEIIL
jgi:3-deoxy-manno-octulosonate cytidylyltransferase (CMP-KDO synthetase)